MTHESTATTTVPADPVSSPSWGTLSASDRSRLLQCYRTGMHAAGNPQYAVDMFAVCVTGDPGNVAFLQAFLAALKRKYGSKKGGGFKALLATGGRAGMKRSAANAQWRDVIKQGVEILKSNPGDTACLLAMAEACENLMYVDCQAFYLRAALDAAPAEVEVNRQCARFAANQGNFDQAIECWRRIARVKGMGEEAEREIAQLSVDKTIHAGKGLTGRAGGGQSAAQAEPGKEPGKETSRHDTLLRTVRDNPADVEASLELADLLEQEGRITDAEKLLAKALAASGNELKVLEHVEDRQLRWARSKLLIAEQRLEAEPTPERQETVEKLKRAQLRQEIEIFGARCSRYPENLTWKYELALRLKAAGKFPEAIRHFQEALKDVRRKGVISLELGECFQSIKQYPLAMQNYEAAVEALTDRELELRKRALYRAGVLAAGLKDLDAAQKHLSAVAGLDYGYRDVAQRLDKLRSAHDKGVSEE
jgi:tetratricopeptide (TPR) repeat protein